MRIIDVFQSVHNIALKIESCIAPDACQRFTVLPSESRKLHNTYVPTYTYICNTVNRWHRAQQLSILRAVTCQMISYVPLLGSATGT